MLTRCCSYTGKVGNGQQLLYVSEICINENETLSDTITEVTGIIADDECESKSPLIIIITQHVVFSKQVFVEEVYLLLLVHLVHME